ncbi:hypothetical protein [Geobacillus stearothermophilus]|uniref:hypothetical protein n=1 Tax=Geobacillus stearothermophilus TaxID=1422 RepID=UPI002402840E|nr:hypothetical protein [Geobacillus stearothermophilus]MDF9296112.1 hypothetical protein [Geobacillus stearothermophilus]
MPQQNGRLNTDLDNKLTSSYYDGAKWHMFIKALNADIEALGSTTDPATAQTVIGLLKALVAKLPSALQNDAIKAAITAALPAGTNKIGSVDIANSPTVRVDSTTPVNTNVSSSLPAGNNKIGSVDIANKPTVLVDSATPVNVNVANNPTVKIDSSQPVNVAINGGGSLDVKVTNTEPLTVKVDMQSFVNSLNVTPQDIAMTTKAAAAANTPEIVMTPSSVFGPILEYIIIAKGTNRGPIYIGGQTMEPNQGKKLMPGEEFRIQYGGALYFSAENAGDQIDVMAAYVPISMLMPNQPGGGDLPPLEVV